MINGRDLGVEGVDEEENNVDRPCLSAAFFRISNLTIGPDRLRISVALHREEMQIASIKDLLSYCSCEAFRRLR